MKWTASTTQPVSRNFVIENFQAKDLISGSLVEGYYLYVYENGIDLYDYLQDTYEIAVDQAYEQFNVPKDSWHRIE